MIFFAWIDVTLGLIVIRACVVCVRVRGKSKKLFLLRKRELLLRRH